MGQQAGPDDFRELMDALTVRRGEAIAAGLPDPLLVKNYSIEPRAVEASADFKLLRERAEREAIKTALTRKNELKGDGDDRA